MKVALGCDHAAYEYKVYIREFLLSKGYEVIDVGTEKGVRVDYPDVAEMAGKLINDGLAERGILACGTGVGMSISANKIPGIRAAAVSDHYSARLSRLHNDCNILCVGQRVVGAEVALELVEIFLQTEFEGGRHARRVEKIAQLEKKYR